MSWVLAGLALVVVLLLLAFGTNPGSNLWRTLTDRDYRIPPQSSLWAFVPTAMNTGSGNWWIYGEDGDNFYHFTGQPAQPFRAISRDAARACQGFDPKRAQTWCS